MKNNLLLVDGSSLLYTQYFATLPAILKDNDDPTYYHLLKKNRYGVYCNALPGFFRVIGGVMQSVKATGLAVAIDTGYHSFRKKAYPDYKANRPPKPYPLVMQADILLTGLKTIGIPVYTSDVFEGDDIIATITDKDKLVYDTVTIITSDCDYYQLVGKNVFLAKYIPVETKRVRMESMGVPRLHGNYFFWNESLVKSDFRVRPDQITDYKALAGDSSDNIPGVKGIGRDTAVKILSEFNHVEDLYQMVDQADSESVIRRLQLAGVYSARKIYHSLSADYAKADCLKAKKLATMYTNVQVGDISMRALQVHVNKDRYQQFAQEFMM